MPRPGRAGELALVVAPVGAEPTGFGFWEVSKRKPSLGTWTWSPRAQGHDADDIARLTTSPLFFFCGVEKDMWEKGTDLLQNMVGTAVISTERGRVDGYLSKRG